MLLALTSCLWLRDVDALSREGVESDGSTPDATADVTQEDGNVPGLDAATCPGDAGPAPVRIGAYCIDSTEVRVKDYRAFLDSTMGDTSGQRSGCAWNDTYKPTQGGIPDTADDAKPIVNVDFCDAVAFCAWAGKRLCGAIDGGTGKVDDFGNAASSQWFRACSRNDDGLHAWPYGNAYDADTCNGDKEAGTTIAVGSLLGCNGGYPGLFDMSGNVREWEDACDLGATADASTCLVRGGAFYDVEGTLSCDNRQVMPMTLTNPGVGFRCCSP